MPYYEPKDDNYDIYIINSNGQNKRNLTARPGYEIMPKFSPDGSFIIFQSWQFGVKEIFFINLLEGNEINLTRVAKNVMIYYQKVMRFHPMDRKLFLRQKGTEIEIYM